MLITDVWVNIANYLTITEIQTLRLTNSYIHDTLQQEGVWGALIERDFTSSQIQDTYITDSTTRCLSYRSLYIELYNIYCSLPYTFPGSTDHTVSESDIVELSKVVFLGRGNDSRRIQEMIRQGKWLWHDQYLAVIGIDFILSTLRPRKPELPIHKLQFWIMAGPERFRSVTSMYFRNTRVAIVLVNLEEDIKLNNSYGNSLGEAQQWIADIKSHSYEFPMMLLGIGHSNKIYSSSNVTRSDILKYCNEVGVVYFEVTDDKFIPQMTLVIKHILKQPKPMVQQTTPTVAPTTRCILQ
jgi:GTPase SAR1 family protein